jgi:hypothetical protein
MQNPAHSYADTALNHIGSLYQRVKAVSAVIVAYRNGKVTGWQLMDFARWNLFTPSQVG